MPTVFEDVIAWLWHERRVKHSFLDLKLTPGQEDAALSLLAHLYRLTTCSSFRSDLVFHLLSPHLESSKRCWPRPGACPSLRRYDSTPTLSSLACAMLPGSSVCAIFVWDAVCA